MSGIVNVRDLKVGTRVMLGSGAEVEIVSNPGDGGMTLPDCSASMQAQMARSQGGQAEKPKAEDLGKQTFQGIEARGHRTTWTYPPGLVGNTDLLVHSSEIWFSTTPGLEGINVRQVSDDPRSGKETRELVGFTQGEPDAALFQPPQDYVVQTQETHSEVRCP